MRIVACSVLFFVSLMGMEEQDCSDKLCDANEFNASLDMSNNQLSHIDFESLFSTDSMIELLDLSDNPISSYVLDGRTPWPGMPRPPSIIMRNTLLDDDQKLKLCMTYRDKTINHIEQSIRTKCILSGSLCSVPVAIGIMAFAQTKLWLGMSVVPLSIGLPLSTFFAYKGMYKCLMYCNRDALQEADESWKNITFE